MQEARVGSAINTLKYGMGMALRSSPYSISAMQSPYLRDIANANLSVQYEQPDYSAFLRPDIWNPQGGGAGGGGGGFGTVRPGNFQPGLNIPGANQPGIANYNPFADNPVYPAQQRQMAGGAAPNYRVDFSGIDQSPNPYALPVTGAQEDF
jgi:hypothetical protein